MRTRVGPLLAGVALVASVAGLTGAAPATAQTPTSQNFSGYGTGTVLGLNALGVGSTIVANVQVAHSAGAVNSQGLTTSKNDELGQNVNPASPTKDAYGRGAGAEVGLVQGSIQGVDTNQVILSQLAEAFAPPPQGPIVKEIPIDLTPILKAPTAHGEADATFDPNTCAVGKPISFGRGFVENLQVLNSTSTAVIATNTAGDNVSESRTVTYLVPNGDGTFGLAAETHLHVAPITLLSGSLTPITVQIAGELVMKTIATGKPGGAQVQYPGTPVITVSVAGVNVVGPITLQSLLGQGGLNLPLGAVGTVTAGTPPHPIGGSTTAPAVLASDGTSASAAVDAVRLSLLQGLGLNVADLRVGHMEGSVSVPAGGIKCSIPVSKTADPDPVTVGNTFTLTITIPSDQTLFSTLFGCDLVNITAQDVTSSDGPTFTLTGADHGGVISSDGTTVTWGPGTIGNYHIGDPPITLHITGSIPGNSPAGTLMDTANVSASLGNCNGTGNGQDIIGSAVTGGQVIGSVTLNGPQVSRSGVLAATGGDSRLLLVGGVLLLGALGVRKRMHKPSKATS